MKRAAVDTIAAIATPAGRGGVGIVRVSGPLVPRICELPCRRSRRRRARLCCAASATLASASASTRAYCCISPRPAPIPARTWWNCRPRRSRGWCLLLQAACAAGARPARPGEFSERAFLNGCLDLAQAEAVADLIDASSRSAARAALHSLQGEFSNRVQGLLDELIAVRADLEAALDFADEDVPWITPQTLHDRTAGLGGNHRRPDERGGDRAAAQREGMAVAIAGQPNVGKSTLLNRLAGAEAAIVSPQAGTTRDLLREQIVVDGLPLTVIDTAGLRDTQDPVEREGCAPRLGRAGKSRADPVPGRPTATVLPKPMPPCWPACRRTSRPCCCSTNAISAAPPRAATRTPGAASACVCPPPPARHRAAGHGDQARRRIRRRRRRGPVHRPRPLSRRPAPGSRPRCAWPAPTPRKMLPRN